MIKVMPVMVRTEMSVSLRAMNASPNITNGQTI